MRASIPPGTASARTPQVPAWPCIQRPNALSGSFQTRSEHAKSQENSEGNFRTFRAEKPFTRCLKRPAEWSFWTRLEATGGTQTHSRRTGGKLGRLRRARQAIVRLSESNTKYGGKEGITGGCRACDRAQVSVSPRGFPREKIMRGRPPQSFHPLFTGRPRNRPGGRRRRNFPLATERIWAGMPAPPWSPSQISGMVGAHPTGPFIP